MEPLNIAFDEVKAQNGRYIVVEAVKVLLLRISIDLLEGWLFKALALSVGRLMLLVDRQLISTIPIKSWSVEQPKRFDLKIFKSFG